jgi:hypothetical protein
MVRFVNLEPWLLKVAILNRLASALSLVVMIFIPPMAMAAIR